MTPEQTQCGDRLEAILLAAGRGLRLAVLDESMPKVLLPVADRPMIHWVVDACEAVGCQRIVLVLGVGADRVRRELAGRPSCAFVHQAQQLGTGHAVAQAQGLYTAGPQTDLDLVDILVLCGDGPLITPQTLRRLVEAHRTRGAAATLATATLENPDGYGRILRDGKGRFQRIVEQREATEAQRAIREVNPSYYCFRASALFGVLPMVQNKNASGEYYLTDVLGLLLERGESVEVVEAVPPGEAKSINTPQQLHEVDAILRQRLTVEASR